MNKKPSPPKTPEAASHQPATDASLSVVVRAEALVEAATSRMGHLLDSARHATARAVARAREEVEDIVAEANSLRRKQPPQ